MNNRLIFLVQLIKLIASLTVINIKQKSPLIINQKAFIFYK